MKFFTNYSRLLVFVLLLPASAYCSNIGGYVQGTLILENSPYNVTADLKIANGDTLEIEPGVVLKFNTSTTFIVYGYLRAIGTETDSITFTTEAEVPNVGSWAGVYFSPGSDGLIAYCLVEYASVGLTLDATSPPVSRSSFFSNNTGIDCLSGAAPTIELVRLLDNPNAGIRVLNSSPTIKSCDLHGNSSNGIESAIVLQGAGATIQQNTIYENTNSGIDLTNSSDTKIYQNTIVANDMGITISDCDPTIISNIVALNLTGISTENSAPVVHHNAFSSNLGGNYINPPGDLGVLAQVNASGDSCDIFYNIQLPPLFSNTSTRDFRIVSGSPCIDTADSTNPAAIVFTGDAPDMGAYENNGTLTPVELVAFTAFDNTLCWSTLSESNNLGFYIETAKAASGPFSTIGFVEGAGTTTEPQNYSFPFKSEISQQLYRLKQIDFDGSFAYSSVIQVGAMPTNFNLLQNSPNPFSVPNQTTIELQLPEEQRVTLHVYDILGKHVKTLCDRIMPAGISRVYWDGQNAQGRTVSAGTYLYVLNNGKHKLCKSLTVF